MMEERQKGIPNPKYVPPFLFIIFHVFVDFFYFVKQRSLKTIRFGFHHRIQSINNGRPMKIKRRCNDTNENENAISPNMT